MSLEQKAADLSNRLKDSMGGRWEPEVISSHRAPYEVPAAVIDLKGKHRLQVEVRTTDDDRYEYRVTFTINRNGINPIKLIERVSPDLDNVVNVVLDEVQDIANCINGSLVMLGFQMVIKGGPSNGS